MWTRPIGQGNRRTASDLYSTLRPGVAVSRASSCSSCNNRRQWQPCTEQTWTVRSEPPALCCRCLLACLLDCSALFTSRPAKLDTPPCQCPLPICGGGRHLPHSSILLQGIVRGNHTQAILPKQIMGPTSHQGGTVSTSQNKSAPSISLQALN